MFITGECYVKAETADGARQVIADAMPAWSVIDSRAYAISFDPDRAADGLRVIGAGPLAYRVVATLYVRELTFEALMQ